MTNWKDKGPLETLLNKRTIPLKLHCVDDFCAFLEI